MNYFSIVLVQIIGFVIYILIGIAGVRMKVLTPRSLGVLSQFITKISLPLLLFTNTLNGATHQEFVDDLPVLAVTALLYFLLYPLSRLLARLFNLKGNENHVYSACSMFGNIGFMGIPIVAAVFPEQGMLYIALFTVVDQLLLWTVGVNLTAPTDKENAMSIASRLLKMVNPATIAVTLAVIGIFMDAHLPQSINIPLTKAGAVTTPLAMIYMGGLFCFIDLKKYIGKKEFYGTVLVKMCLFPIFFYELGTILGVMNDIVITLSLLSALPTMAAVVMLAQNQQSAGEYAAGMTLVTTICSIFTLPLVCLYFG